MFTVDIQNPVDPVTVGARLSALLDVQNLYQLIIAALLSALLVGGVVYFYRKDGQRYRVDDRDNLRRKITEAETRRDRGERPQYGDVRLLERYESRDPKLMEILNSQEEPEETEEAKTGNLDSVVIRAGAAAAVVALVIVGIVLWSNAGSQARQQGVTAFQTRTAQAVTRSFQLQATDAVDTMPTPDQSSAFTYLKRVNSTSPALGCVVKQKNIKDDTWRVAVSCEGVNMQATQ